MLRVLHLIYVLGAVSQSFDAKTSLTSLRSTTSPADPMNYQEAEMIENLLTDFAAALEKFYQHHFGAYGPTRKYLNVVTDSSPFAVQAASMSFWAYDLEYFEQKWGSKVWAGGWKVVKKYINTTSKSLAPGLDVVALFRRKDECVLSFAGTTGLADWSTNLNVKTLQSLEECGLQNVHEGFFEDFVQFMLGDTWSDEIEPEIQSECGGRLSVTGHSQGAVLAELFAACVNRVDAVTLPDLWRWGQLVHPGRRVSTRVTVTGVYGVASPGCTVDSQLENANMSGGVFSGVRFFNMDSESFDPVPWITAILNFQHAKYQAIQLVSKGQELVKYHAGTFDARWQPLTSTVFGKLLSLPNHMGPEYMRRILAFTRKVWITILAGQNFSEECVLGGINPYIEVQVENGKENHLTQKTSTGLLDAAFWNETFLLTSYEPGSSLELSAWNDCTMDFKMGSVVLQSIEFDPTGFAGWLSLDTGAQLQISVRIEELQF